MTAEATVAGHAVPLDHAIAAAADLLRSSRRAVVAGLDTDVAGIEAAIRLARRLGGAVDHAHSASALRDQQAMRTGGWIVTTPLQVRARADTVLMVGAGLAAARPDVFLGLALERPPALAHGLRRTVLNVGESAAEIGVLRAAVAGRSVRDSAGAARSMAETLRAARYGAVVWDAAGLDGLAVQMLCGLVDDLNAHTRFAGLPLPPPGNAAGAMQASAWLTGLPLPVGFSGHDGAAVHDAFLFSADRLVDGGEADAAVWIGSEPATRPAWQHPVPTVALLAEGVALDPPVAVSLTIGRAGIDHDGVVFDAALGALAARQASAPGGAPRCADLLERIGAAL